MAQGKNLVVGGLLLGVLAAFLVALGLFLAAPEFSTPIASSVCSEGETLGSGTNEFSYKPGQHGIEAALVELPGVFCQFVQLQIASALASVSLAGCATTQRKSWAQLPTAALRACVAAIDVLRRCELRCVRLFAAVVSHVM